MLPKQHSNEDSTSVAPPCVRSPRISLHVCYLPCISPSGYIPLHVGPPPRVSLSVYFALRVSSSPCVSPSESGPLCVYPFQCVYPLHYVPNFVFVSHTVCIPIKESSESSSYQEVRVESVESSLFADF